MGCFDLERSKSKKKREGGKKKEEEMKKKDPFIAGANALGSLPAGRGWP